MRVFLFKPLRGLLRWYTARMSERRFLFLFVMHVAALAVLLVLFIYLYEWYPPVPGPEGAAQLPPLDLNIFHPMWFLLMGTWAVAPYVLVSLFVITGIHLLWLLAAFRRLHN